MAATMITYTICISLGRFISCVTALPISDVHFCYRVSSSAAAALPRWRPLIVRLLLKFMASPLRFVPAGKFPNEEKIHANRKSHKIVTTCLEMCCLC